jgi:four helix bundle protein
MLSNFRSYQLATEFYWRCETIRCRQHLKLQLLRASSSIVLNLAEGDERSGPRDRVRFFQMAMGSARECQAILKLIRADDQTTKMADNVAKTIFALCRKLRSTTPVPVTGDP